MSKHKHAHSDYQPVRSFSHQLEGIPLFDPPAIQTPAPSAPGSETSRLAAESVSDPMRRESHRLLMLIMGTTDRALSMFELHERTGLAINIVCARIPELEGIWLQRHRKACQSRVKESLAVDGFTLTAAGRARVKGAA